MHIPPTDDDACASSGPLERRDGHPVQVGDAVRIRRQRWRVAALRAIDGCTVVTLTGAGPGNVGLERRVLSRFEDIEPLKQAARVRMASWRRWRAACRALLAQHGPASALRTALRAHIDLLPFQLEPALAVVSGLGSRVLIADEVGLGKTIQAGLIVSELLARGAADRVLVLVPAGLREQWADELSTRFAIEAVLLDMREARRRASELPLGVNPWSTTPVAITSVDYAKRPEVLPAALGCRWDIVVVDEVHGVAPGTDRHDAVAALCAQAPHVVLITATPHSGDEAAFASLCGLGRHTGERLLAFRRNHRDAAFGSRRRIHRLQVRPSSEELRMHERLASFTDVARAEGPVGGREAWLALTTLHKRAMSSAFALEQSARRRLRILALDLGEGRQLLLPLDGSGEIDASDEALPWTVPVLRDAERERRLLLALADAAGAAARRETKFQALARLLARLCRRGEHVIVFTEYRDTLLHLRDRLPFDCSVLHGGLNRDERRAALERFDAGRPSILLATDAAGEGLNLQRNCRVVINLELPWNPTRLEQRAGRVDRIGQRRAVHTFHLIARDTGEVRILERLKARIGTARRAIDVNDPLGFGSPDEEEVVSRLVLTGDVVGSSDCAVEQSRSVEPSIDEDSLQQIRLEAEGLAEHARLVRSRAFLPASDQHGKGRLRVVDQSHDPAVAAGPLLTIARHPTLRSRFGSRFLIIVRSQVVDHVGRIVASHLTALLIGLSTRLIRRAAVESLAVLLQSLPAAALVDLDPAYAVWRTDSHHCHRRYWERRLGRERAVRDARSTNTPVRCQPGLFDRRAVQALHEDSERRQVLADDDMGRITAADVASSINTTESAVVLVLVP